MNTGDFKAYLTYNATPVVRARALTECKHTGYILKIDGKELDCKHELKRELREDLLKIGATIDEYKMVKYRGKVNMFGVSVKTQVLNFSGLDAIRIRICEKTESEMKESVSKIRDGFRSYGYKPTVCMWSKNGKL